MAEPVFSLDTSVIVKALVTEEPAEESEIAAGLLRRALSEGRIVLPSWAWAELGSVLRKKVRQGLLQSDEAATVWASFLELPIEFLDSREIRESAWQIARRYDLATLYDAAFLACAEQASATLETTCEFWTADLQFIDALGPATPDYVRLLRRR